MSQMTSKERVLRVLSGGIPDRVPTLTFGIDPKFIKIFGQGSIEKTFQVLGLDVYHIYSQNWCQGMPLAAGLRQEIPPDMQTAGGTFAGWHGVDEFGRVWKKGSCVGGVVRTEEDIEKYVPDLKLEERTNPGRARHIMEKHPDKAFALTTHTGPFGLTMESIGFEEFMYRYVDDRPFIEKLLWERTKWFGEIAGIHSLEPTAGVDMGKVKKNYGNQLILVGNVDCGEPLCHGDLEKVRQDINRCMSQAKDSGRYILSDSNSIHAGCHPEAVKEMFRYAKEIGWY